jgi:hypothetical protein
MGMRGTNSEMLLLARQLRKARDELVRAKLMFLALLDHDPDDDDGASGHLENLDDWADEIHGILDYVVKAQPEDEAENEAGDMDDQPPA